MEWKSRQAMGRLNKRLVGVISGGAAAAAAPWMATLRGGSMVVVVAAVEAAVPRNKRKERPMGKSSAL